MAQSAELLNTLPEPGALTTAIYFPDHPTKQFPAGDVVSLYQVLVRPVARRPRPLLTLACCVWPCPQITAVISAHNDNTKSYNLTAVVASLNSPMDFSMYIQNFTHRVSPWEPCLDMLNQ
jgi:hypothetical protein